ncbi:MAG TPA: anhydro-N-acetylmuramic acid kinase, partial [Ferruginibacter sp.]|nr:anhydro-N-acetylmuramic acid kinase [Ferruginibacter sp.]
MNKNIRKLRKIADKDTRYIIGLMSGTSLDGLDIALCKIKGSGLKTKLKIEKFITKNYDDDFRAEIKEIFSKDLISLQKLCLLNEWIAGVHAGMINDSLDHWRIKNTDIDLLASHGQTVYHAPLHLHQKNKYGNGTLQIGDGDHLSVKTGIITICDFRQKHIAAGGEGAPLALYGDHILFSRKGEDRLLLNIGGIANYTFLPGSLELSDITCTDTGPGNTLMDVYIQQHYPGINFDENAAVAKKGTVNKSLLGALMDDPFFNQPFPKTTGPELFNLQYLEEAKKRSHTLTVSHQDTMATLNRFTADSILLGIREVVKKGCKLFSSGGGMHNPLLMRHL